MQLKQTQTFLVSHFLQRNVILLKFRETIEGFQKHPHEGSKLVCAFHLTFICLHTHSVATYVLLERHMCHHSPKCVSVSLCFDVCDNTPAGHLHASLVSPGVSQHEGVAPARGRNDGERRWSYICKVNSGNYSPLCEQRVKYNICIRR